jgi:two-component system response regulator NreC
MGVESPPVLRVLIIDDHAVLRAGLWRLLQREPGIAPVAQAANASEGVSAAAEHQPDIVLMDVTMPGENGIEAIPRLLAASPSSKVLVVSMHDDARYVRDAFAAGASGYVLKEAADAELVTAIQQVAAGGTHVNPGLRAVIAVPETKVQTEAASDPLSEREHEVLRLLTLGQTNQQIAEKLGLSVKTAETHRADIMRKLGLRSRAELVRYARAQDLPPL